MRKENLRNPKILLFDWLFDYRISADFLIGKNPFANAFYQDLSG
ncbi:MAG: hypothetical protein ANABAC_3551 [Anaerolineae bacterium]|nr:MAG: hypothetical protein ANABAC_3551 [Anaerolineae bacterium]